MLLEDGFSIVPINARYDHDWKAAYGLELIRITKEAEEIEQATGAVVEVYYPTEEEFRMARKAFHKGSRIGLKQDHTYNLHIPDSSLLR